MRLMLIEDDALIARELALHWRSQGWVPDLCTTLAEAQNALEHSAETGGFELIVLDLGLPDGDGLQWLAQFRARDRLTPVLVLSARGQVSERVLGLQTGADDYLVKPFAVNELDARVAALRRRGQLTRGELLHFGRLSWLGGEGVAYSNGQVLELSPREFEVLGLLIGRAPRLLAKRHLMEALAERDFEASENAVETYISRLRRKLIGSGTAIRTMRGFGYMLVLHD
ncbi:MAG: DNA-binding response regulator [Betaproteobacteria bacterium]|jgi:DNA-binding response OmpR family regulator|nr:DNA-binding response regulator [Betaproteobacteria bacterium]